MSELRPVKQHQWCALWTTAAKSFHIDHVAAATNTSVMSRFFLEGYGFSAQVEQRGAKNPGLQFGMAMLSEKHSKNGKATHAGQEVNSEDRWEMNHSFALLLNFLQKQEKKHYS